MKSAPVVTIAPRPAQEPKQIDVPNPYEEDVDLSKYPALAGFLSLAGQS